MANAPAIMNRIEVLAVLKEAQRKNVRVNLAGADLTGANLAGANLAGADLAGAKLILSRLVGANLAGADLAGAKLIEANLFGADLTGAITPDGRVWEDYLRDPFEGICTSDEVRAKAIAAWGNHTWADCPMHAALGISSIVHAPDPIRVGFWVAVYDAGLLPDPRMEVPHV